MGKRKRGRPDKFSQGKVSESVGSAYDEGYKTVVDPNSRDYVYDEVDQYHDDIRANNLTEAVKRMKVHKAKKERVLSLGMDSSDEEEEPVEESEESEEEESEDVDDEESEEEDDKKRSLRPFLEDDDIIEEREDQLPDERAWGKDKSVYYGTNVTDQIIRKRATHQHINEVRDVTNLELEANKAYQRRMAEALKDLDYMEMINLGDEVEESKKAEANMPATPKSSDGKLVFSPEDTKNMTKAEKLKLLKKLSPEYIPLCSDMTEKLGESLELLQPILRAHKDCLLGDCSAMKYVQTKFCMSNNYALLVLSYMWLTIEIGHNAIKTHPVMEKLTRYRYLFQKLEHTDKIMKPQLEVILHRIKNKIPLNLIHPPKPKEDVKAGGGKMRKLSILKKTKSNDKTTDEPEAKKVKLVLAEESDSDDDGANASKSNAMGEGSAEKDSRRHIGKVITKNKGLTPHRKKELKNPRIKYKTKYNQKIKRRKGAVRAVRKEIPAYCGEMSGINPYVIKSRKF